MSIPGGRRGSARFSVALTPSGVITIRNRESVFGSRVEQLISSLHAEYTDSSLRASSASQDNCELGVFVSNLTRWRINAAQERKNFAPSGLCGTVPLFF